MPTGVSGLCQQPQPQELLSQPQPQLVLVLLPQPQPSSRMMMRTMMIQELLLQVLQNIGISFLRAQTFRDRPARFEAVRRIRDILCGRESMRYKSEGA